MNSTSAVGDGDMIVHLAYVDVTKSPHQLRLNGIGICFN